MKRTSEKLSKIRLKVKSIRKVDFIILFSVQRSPFKKMYLGYQRCVSHTFFVGRPNSRTHARKGLQLVSQSGMIDIFIVIIFLPGPFAVQYGDRWWSGIFGNPGSFAVPGSDPNGSPAPFAG